MRTRWLALAALLALAACGGESLEGFGSPRPVSAGTWRGWCSVRAELVRTFDAFFLRKTLTRTEFVSSAARLGTAAADWSLIAKTEGARDIGTLLAAVAEATGHTKVQVYNNVPTNPGRAEFNTAIGALPPCAGQGEPAPVPPESPSVSPTPKPSTPSATASSSAPECRATDLAVSIASDRKTYSESEAIRLTLTARNSSSSACAVVTGRCLDIVEVDSAGAEVWNSGAGGSCPATVREVIVPGEGIALAFTWDQSCTPADCTGRAPPGSYQAHGRWTARAGRIAVSGSASFTIRSSSSPSPSESSSPPFP